MKGCLGAALALVLVFAAIGLGIFKLFQEVTTSVDDFPDYAKREAVYAQYGTLIDDVETAIDESESMHDLAARLEKLSAPEELLYLKLTKESDDLFDREKLEIVEKFDVMSYRQTIIDGTGHGHLNDVPVIVINLPVNRHSIEECFIYLQSDQKHIQEDD